MECTKTFQCYKKRISVKVIFVLQTIFFEGDKAQYNKKSLKRKNKLEAEYIETTKQEKRVRFVVLFTLFIVAIEVAVGIVSHSMALLADAIHLMSHELIFRIKLGSIHL